MNNRRTYVYFISSKRKYPRFDGKIRVKIGLAFNPDARKRQLQTGAENLLYHYRSPLTFYDRGNAKRFELWAQHYAGKKGRRLVYPGGREFFEIRKEVVGEIVSKYREITGRSAGGVLLPYWTGIFFAPLLAIYLFATYPLRPIVWLSDVVAIYCKEKYGITPVSLILTHLFIAILVLQISFIRTAKKLFSLSSLSNKFEFHFRDI